jgi:hypothetical protein
MREPFFNDDILVAYADGELLEPTAEAVRAMAMRDPAIAGRIGMFKASRKVLSAAFDPMLDWPVPQRLCDAVQALGRDDGTRRADVQRWPTAVRVARLRGWRWQQAMAASIACSLCIAAGWLLGTSSWRQDNSGSLATEVASLPGTLIDALDRLPSGERAGTRLDGGAAEVVPIASYENRGSLCREFEMSRSSAVGSQAVRGVVCRGDGRWLLKAVADLTSRKARSDEYWPASGGQDLALVLGLGRSLSQQEERQFLANGWRDR